MISEEVFVRTVRENEVLFYKTAYSILRNDEDVKDAIQESILKAYEKLWQLRDETKLKTWIMSILINTAKQIYRQRKDTCPEEELESIPAPVFEGSEPDSIWEVVMELGSKYSVIVELYYNQEYSTKEIAVLLKLSESVVRKRLSRAREMLRKRLSSKEDEYGTI